MSDLMDEMEAAAMHDQDAARAEGVKDGKAMQKKVLAGVKADNRRLSSDLVLSQAETASLHANTPALLAEAARQGAQQQEGKTNEVVDQLNQVAMEKVDTEFENEQLKKKVKLNRALLDDSKKRTIEFEDGYKHPIALLEL